MNTGVIENKTEQPDFEVRLMRIEDYEEVHALWMTIKGFGVRSIDDSKRAWRDS